MNETESRPQPGLAPEPNSIGAAGYLRGLLGAILGAVVGVVPWFILSTFVGFYVGWLGFLVGWVSLFGYKLLRGAKSTGYATAVIFVFSVLAIIFADFFSNMYNLFQDKEFAAAVEFYGISKFEITWLVITDPENLSTVLVNLVLGLVIGVLGLVSTLKQIRAYAAPQTVIQEDAADALPQTGPIDTAMSGFQLPHSFSVTAKKSAFVIGIICTALFGAMTLLCVFVGVDEGDNEMYFIAVFFLCLTLLGVFLIMSAKLRKLEVAGESLVYTNWCGKRSEFSSREIAYITRPTIESLVMFGRDGKKILKIEKSMTNFPLMLQYLYERNVELRG